MLEKKNKKFMTFLANQIWSDWVESRAKLLKRYPHETFKNECLKFLDVFIKRFVFSIDSNHHKYLQMSTEKINASINEMNLMVEILFEDLITSAKLLSGESQFSRRSYVRTLFALIEGMVYQMKRVALCAYEADQVEFNEAEISILKEETYELTTKGTAKSRQGYPKTLENILFAFYVYGKVFKSIFEPDVRSNGWQSLQQAMKIRNRITHPKNINDMNISDEDIKILDNASKWFQDNNLSIRNKKYIMPDS